VVHSTSFLIGQRVSIHWTSWNRGQHISWLIGWQSSQKFRLSSRRTEIWNMKNIVRENITRIIVERSIGYIQQFNSIRILIKPYVSFDNSFSFDKIKQSIGFQLFRVAHHYLRMTLYIQMFYAIIRNVTPGNTSKHTEVVNWRINSIPSFVWIDGRNNLSRGEIRQTVSTIHFFNSKARRYIIILQNTSSHFD